MSVELSSEVEYLTSGIFSDEYLLDFVSEYVLIDKFHHRDLLTGLFVVHKIIPRRKGHDKTDPSLRLGVVFWIKEELVKCISVVFFVFFFFLFFIRGVLFIGRFVIISFLTGLLGFFFVFCLIFLALEEFIKSFRLTVFVFIVIF